MFQRSNRKKLGDDYDADDKKSKRVSLSLSQRLAVLLCWVLSVWLAAVLLNNATADNTRSSPAVHDIQVSQPQAHHELVETNSLPSKTCSAQGALRQGKFASAAKVRGCPPDDDAWLRLAQLLMPQAKVFFDIGSNKGFSAARFYELWVPELGLNSRGLHAAIKLTSKEKDLIECGACNDCMEAGVSLMPVMLRFCAPGADKTQNQNLARQLLTAVGSMCSERAQTFRPLRIYSFDGNPVMVDGVRKARDYLADNDIGYSRLQDVSDISEERLPQTPKKHFLKDYWSLELAAFTGDDYVPGKTMEFILGIGEKGHLTGTSGEKAKDGEFTNRAQVPVLSIDALIAREKLDHVDLIKVDTEGYDPTVLKGARETLKKHKVTLVIFEYNKLWRKEDTLGSVVKELFDAHDYACYLEGKNLLLKLTQNCWSHELEIRQWSNVWCASLRVSEGISLATVFDSYSVAFL